MAPSPSQVSSPCLPHAAGRHLCDHAGGLRHRELHGHLGADLQHVVRWAGPLPGRVATTATQILEPFFQLHGGFDGLKATGIIVPKRDS